MKNSRKILVHNSLDIMPKSFCRNKVTVIVKTYENGRLIKRVQVRVKSKAINLIRESSANEFSIKVIYFSDKNLVNESVIGNKKYVLSCLDAFLEADLVREFQNMIGDYKKIDNQGNKY